MKQIYIFTLLFILVGCTYAKNDASTKTSNVVTSISYDKLGFTKNFNEQLELSTMWNREDGVLDPFKDADIEIVMPNYNDEIPINPVSSGEPSKSLTYRYEYVDPFYDYFNTDQYTIYRRPALSFNGYYYADTALVDGTYKLQFFADGSSPYNTLSARPYPFIDGIESNGIFGYVINNVYFDREAKTNIKDTYYNLFYVIYHDDDLPFTVYFSKSYLFLIPKDSSFDQSCIDVLNSTEGIYLFK